MAAERRVSRRSLGGCEVASATEQQMPRNFGGSLHIRVLPNPRDHHIQDRRGAGAGDAVLRKRNQRLRDADLRKQLLEPREIVPVDGGGVMIEQAGFGKREAAILDADQLTSRTREALQPASS